MSSSSGVPSSNKPRLPGTEKKILGLPESTAKALAGGVLVVAAVFGVLKYTGRDRDVEGEAKKAKRSIEKKLPDWGK